MMENDDHHRGILFFLRANQGQFADENVDFKKPDFAREIM